MTKQTIHIPTGYKPSPLGPIPEDWEVKRLGEICDIDKESLSSKTDPEYKFDYISLSDVDSDNFEISTSKQIFKTAPSRARRIVKKGDVIISTVRPNLQAFFLIKNNVENLIVSTGFAVLTPQKNVLGEYLIQYVFSDKVSRQFFQLVVGSNYPAVNSSDIAHLKLAIPPIKEQEKICNVLQLWDTAIAKQTALIEKLTLRKRGLMKQLLTGKKRLEGFGGEWKKCTYSNILSEVKRTLIWDEDELYKLISVRRRSEGLFFRESLYGREIATKNLRPAKTGDFLISKMQIVHGASGLVTEEFDDAKISGSYISLVSKNSDVLDIKYFNLWSQTPIFYHQTFVSSFGVHIEKMTFDFDTFMSFSMPLPPIKEQHAIVLLMDSLNKEIEIAKEKLSHLQNQKRGLMQVLLTGKKRVK
ncbi:MAG: restriction endonuclease subunit S [Bacteroidales bacterium]|nr:restriction endonuclease subunit S [Bacteroidales bacterium]